MVEEIDKVDIKPTYETSVKCPHCGNIIKIDVEWGAGVEMELSKRPIVCDKCGVRLD